MKFIDAVKEMRNGKSIKRKGEDTIYDMEHDSIFVGLEEVTDDFSVRDWLSEKDEWEIVEVQDR